MGSSSSKETISSASPVAVGEDQRPVDVLMRWNVVEKMRNYEDQKPVESGYYNFLHLHLHVTYVVVDIFQLCMK